MTCTTLIRQRPYIHGLNKSLCICSFMEFSDSGLNGASYIVQHSIILMHVDLVAMSRIDWIDVDGIHNWSVTPHCPLWVDVIAKKISKRCLGMNCFVETMIFDNFEHNKENGWRIKLI